MKTFSWSGACLALLMLVLFGGCAGDKSPYVSDYPDPFNLDFTVENDGQIVNTSMGIITGFAKAHYFVRITKGLKEYEPKISTNSSRLYNWSYRYSVLVDGLKEGVNELIACCYKSSGELVRSQPIKITYNPYLSIKGKRLIASGGWDCSVIYDVSTGLPVSVFDGVSFLIIKDEANKSIASINSRTQLVEFDIFAQRTVRVLGNYSYVEPIKWVNSKQFIMNSNRGYELYDASTDRVLRAFENHPLISANGRYAIYRKEEYTIFEDLVTNQQKKINLPFSNKAAINNNGVWITAESKYFPTWKIIISIYLQDNLIHSTDNLLRGPSCSVAIDEKYAYVSAYSTSGDRVDHFTGQQFDPLIKKINLRDYSIAKSTQSPAGMLQQTQYGNLIIADRYFYQIDDINMYFSFFRLACLTNNFELIGREIKPDPEASNFSAAGL